MKGRLDLEAVKAVERLALHAWPGLAVEEIDGWLVRHASGITRRANSVWPNDLRDDLRGTSVLEEKMAQVENFYHARGLPVRFQICPAAQPEDLDEQLAHRGYRAVARTAVQSASLGAMLERLEGTPRLSVDMFTIEVTSQPSPVWWDCYARADEVAPESVATRQAICAQIKQATAYAVVMHGGKAIAVGSAVAEAGWVGFFNVATLAEQRRIGAARAVMLALGKWGKTMGAKDAYLQVMADNEAAWKLYARLGFVTGYYYHYREEVRADAEGVRALRLLLC